jgi:RimJ/RimL family protein N-acetyltransferase
MKAELTLRRATRADIPTIMAIERLPDYEHFVGRSSREGHENMWASGRHDHFVGLDAEQATVAFAILRDLGDPHGNVYLQRVAVTTPGRGVGAAFLDLLVAWAFAHTSAHRFFLDCFSHNARAQRMYEKLGFRREGLMREAYLGADGTRRDLVMMALTRPEWNSAAAPST